MSELARASGTQEHYQTPAERQADYWVHMTGLGAAIAGLPFLIVAAASHGGLGRAVAIAIYAACLLAMLSISAGYNLAMRADLKRRLRRLDHAAIFLMIAGSYTPFTTQALHGALAVGMTLGVWTIALLAASGKLFLPGVSKGFWLPVYLVLGWIILAAAGPLSASLHPAALVLLVAGGVIYTLGTTIYAWPSLPFRRAIWHGFVVAAAGAHYGAILIGVSLA